MKQTFEIIEKHLNQHLSQIAGELEHDGGFKCPKQLEDLENSLKSIHIVKQLGSQVSALK